MPDGLDPAAGQRQVLQLVDQPREELAIELKRWVDLSEPTVRANIARELLALANHGGGYLIFGFTEEAEGWSPAGPCPYLADRYSQDSINAICERHAEPGFHCSVQRVVSTGSNTHVVVGVPGDHRVPIRSKRAPEGSALRDDTYYVRRAGPQSAPVSSGREWDDLLRRCLRAQREELVESFRAIALALGSEGAREVAGLVGGASGAASEQLADWEASCRERLEMLVAHYLADEEPSRYAHGGWSAAYILNTPGESPSLSDFLTILGDVAGHETGWPPWWVPTRDGIRPRPVDGLIECWLAEPGAEEPAGLRMRDAAHSDLWLGDPHGRMSLFRGYQEDGGHARSESGMQIDVTLPTWRTGECLLHAQRLAERLESDTVHFMMRWTGLESRELVSWNSERDIREGRVSVQDTLVSSAQIDVTQISDALPEIVRDLVEPLYALFDFLQPADSFYSEELTKMRRGV